MGCGSLIFFNVTKMENIVKVSVFLEMYEKLVVICMPFFQRAIMEIGSRYIDKQGKPLAVKL